MQKFVLFLVLIFLVVKLSAQEADRLDSLLTETNKEHIDSVYVDMLNAIATEYRNSDMDKVKLFADSALQIATSINYFTGQVKSHFNIGNMYYIKGDFSKTLDSYLKALAILEKTNNKAGIASALMGVGNIHAIQKNTDLAIEYQEKSLKIRMEIHDSLGIAGSYNNLGSIYMDLKQYEKALKYHFKSLEIKEKLKYWKGLSSSYGNIGVALKELGKLKEAVAYQEKALAIRKKLNNKKGMVMSYTDIGNIYHELGQYKKAIANQEKALEIAKEVSYKEGEVMALLSLSATSEKLSRFDKALTYFKSYSIEKDSLFSIKKSKEIADMESVYTAEKQKQQIELLEKDNTIQELKIKTQKKELSVERSKRIAIISILILVICLVFFLIYTVIKRKKANRIIEHQKEVVEEKNKEITDSITYARRIQEAILPTNEFISTCLQHSFVFYQPKDIVAGDFYWMESVKRDSSVDESKSNDSSANKNEMASAELLDSQHCNNEDIILFAVADCTGHGVPGAMVSVVCHNALNRVIREFKLLDPGKILDKTREIIEEQLNKVNGKEVSRTGKIRDGMDIALCVLNKATNQLMYAGANNPLWIIRSTDDSPIKERTRDVSENAGSDLSQHKQLSTDHHQLFEIKGTKQPIGRVENPVKYDTHKIDLEVGDRLYLFSDGFADQFGGVKGKKFKYKSLRELIMSLKDKPMKDQRELLETAFHNWKGDLEQVDDVCVLGVRI